MSADAKKLADGLVHEIKNPLSTLRINLTLLKEDIASDPALHRRVELLESEVERLDTILEDFLRYAGTRELRIAEHDLAAVVGEMGEFLGPGFQRDGCALEIDVAAGPVSIDAARFKQALLNVLLNAQQAVEPGGSVRVSSRRTGRGVEIEVRDDGRGIDAGERERVFDVYYSGSGTGSGLGLPTARRILQDHGGGLELESEPGVGTLVRLWLPAR
ncbi:MAG: sensor histidine kinase [Planctomycetota bacterium]|jgi:signal transduction histidine kinase